MKRTGSHPNFKGLDKSLRLQKIIDTATELFHKKGYRATTLDDVSSELGITKAALYHYVSSKEELLYIIYIQALENIFRNTSKISAMDLPADEKLRLIIRNHVKDIIIQSVSMFSVFFNEENQLSQKDFKKTQEEKKKYNRVVEKIIEDGISQGLFRDFDPRLQANAIIGMCNWVYKWYKQGHSPYTPDQIAGHFVNLLETGYLKKDNQKKQVFLENSGSSKKRGNLPDRGNYYKLKLQCRALIKIIDEIEKSG
jgi:AcrR family transcriptional regulator